MSGELDSGGAQTPRPGIGLFGRRNKPARGAPPAPSPPPRMGRSSVSGLLTFVLLGALATVGAFAWLLKESRSPGPLAADKVVIIVREGDDGGGIAGQLERAGVVDNAMWFNVLILLDGNRGALKRGEYAFKAGMSMNEIENELVAHRVVMHKLTIPEGLTSEQIFERLRDDTVLIGDIKEPPREGSLMPDTYYFERGDTRLSILSRMTKMQAKAVEDVWKGRAPDLPIKSPDEMVTLASIVEKETGKADERPRVAGVFINRLEKHMRLGSDPTIVYGLALGRGTLGRSITRADLNQSTPYNTYIIDGLPPGPICNPGKAALEAVANRTRSKDLYFAADGTGGHVFAETLDEHQKNVAHWGQIEKDVEDKLAPDVALQQAWIDPIDPSQFGALVAPAQGQSAPAAVLARLRRIGADQKAKDLALASLVAPGIKPLEEIDGVVTGVNDAPAEGMAFKDADAGGTAGSGPIASAPNPPAMIADGRTREAKYGTPPLPSNGAVASTTRPAAPASPQPPTASGRPRIFDASEGTRLDPLLNRTYDLSYAKVVPAMQ
jgi:UPF0755 protein